MRSVIVALFPCLLAATVLAAEPVATADATGIRRAALDYIEGWYTQDAARMERALHPQMVKRRQVSILDVHGNAATVKVDADDWVDYLHLVKWNGEWKILNVLWELR